MKSREFHQFRRGEKLFFARRAARAKVRALIEERKILDANSSVRLLEQKKILRGLVAKYESRIKSHLPAPTERERHIARVAAERQKARRAP